MLRSACALWPAPRFRESHPVTHSSRAEPSPRRESFSVISTIFLLEEERLSEELFSSAGLIPPTTRTTPLQLQASFWVSLSGRRYFLGSLSRDIPTKRATAQKIPHKYSQHTQHTHRTLTRKGAELHPCTCCTFSKHSYAPCALSSLAHFV